MIFFFFLVENFDEERSNTTQNDFETQKDNYPPTKSPRECAFFFFTSIFIIYEQKDLIHTLCCCLIRAKALCSSFIYFRFCTES